MTFKKYFLPYLIGICSIYQADANSQTLKSLKIDKTEVAINTPIRAFVEFASAERNWCGFYIDWGDGKDLQTFRIGKKPDVASPVSREKSYDRDGTYVIKAYGDFVTKGLNSATKCDGEVAPVTVIVFDPAKRAAQERQKEAARAERERVELEKSALELEQTKLEVMRKELELKAKELELEKERMKSPEYRALKEKETAERLAREAKERRDKEKIREAEIEKRRQIAERERLAQEERRNKLEKERAEREQRLAQEKAAREQRLEQERIERENAAKKREQEKLERENKAKQLEQFRNL
jgi:hypothetical protein